MQAATIMSTNGPKRASGHNASVSAFALETADLVLI